MDCILSESKYLGCLCGSVLGIMSLITLTQLWNNDKKKMHWKEWEIKLCTLKQKPH